MGIAQFLKLAPYLTNGFVLAGLALFMVAGIVQILAKARLIAKLSQKQSFQLIAYGCLAAILSIIGGLFYEVSIHEPTTAKQSTVTQQTGDCGVNIAGDRNKSDVTCGDKSAGTKAK